MSDNYISVFKQIAALGHVVASECGGDLSCWYCGYDYVGARDTDKHDDGCPYLIAVDVIQKENDNDGR